jgi:hypothetical protein
MTNAHSKVGENAAMGPKGIKNPLQNLVEYRKQFDENQSVFWSRFCVTQSGGSRYESGNKVSGPVGLLLLAHSEGILNDKTLARMRKKLGR